MKDYGRDSRIAIFFLATFAHLAHLQSYHKAYPTDSLRMTESSSMRATSDASSTRSDTSTTSNTLKNPTSDIPWPDRREQLKHSYSITEAQMQELEIEEQAYYDDAVAAAEWRRAVSGVT